MQTAWQRPPRRLRSSRAVAVAVAAAVALALVGFATPAWPTTMIPIADGALADQAELIVEGLVVDRLPESWLALPSTDYQVVVERVLKGSDPGSTVTVRVAGGRSPDGREFVLPAAPRFAPGERVLLFLVAGADRTWGVLHLGLGHFTRRVDDTGLELAVRRAVVEPGMELPGGAIERHWRRWSEWLVDRAAGRHRAADYFVPALADSTPRFSVRHALAEYEGTGVRWFVFEVDRSVQWSYNAEGAPRGHRNAFRRAIRSWNRDKKSKVDLVVVGKTEAIGGFVTADGFNTLMFEDPNNTVPGRYRCGVGGVLATAGWWIDGRRGAYEGRVYFNIFEAEIVINDGAACFAKDNRRGLEELFGHELGHTLGLAHPCGDEDSGSCDTKRQRNALMRGFLHNDGRGSKLSHDDRKGLRILY